MELQLNITKTELNATKQELNTSRVELDGQKKILKNIKLALDKEIANRHQLQYANTELMSNFHNLSIYVNSNMIDIGRLSHKIGRF